MHAAASSGNAECVRLLLDAGARTTATSALSATPLHVAAANGRTRVVRELLAAATPACARDRNAQTIVHMAARSGDAGTLAECLGAFRAQAKGKVTALDRWRRSPLHWAVLAGSATCVRLLLAPVEDGVALAPDPDGTMVPARKVAAKTSLLAETPLEIAVRLGRADIAQLLLDAGAKGGYTGDADVRARALVASP